MSPLHGATTYTGPLQCTVQQAGQRCLRGPLLTVSPTGYISCLPNDELVSNGPGFRFLTINPRG